MNPVDVGVIALVGVGGLLGARRGLVSQLARLVALAGGLYAARMASPEASAAVRAVAPSVGSPLDRAIGFLLVFVLLAAGITIAGAWLRERIKESPLAPLDRAGGALVGGAKGLLLCYVGLFVALMFPLRPLAQELRASRSVPILLRAIGVTAPLFPPEFEARGRAEADTIAQGRAERETPCATEAPLKVK